MSEFIKRLFVYVTTVIFLVLLHIVFRRKEAKTTLKRKYSEDDVSNMTDVLSRNMVTQPVTFPVRAALAANSKALLTGLVRLIPLVFKISPVILHLYPLLPRSSVPGTTLTIYKSTSSDKVDLEALKYLILDLGRDKVYLDLPAGIIQELNLNSPSILPSSSPRTIAASYLILFVVAVFSTLAL